MSFPPPPQALLRTDVPRQEMIALVPELRGFARFLVRDRAEADDLVQEALVRALAGINQFQPDTNMKAWLFAILRNAFFEQNRRRRTERNILERSIEPPSEAQTNHPDSRAALSDLERQIWRLPPLLRESIVLVGAQELSYEEAAVICGVPIGTVKARVSRARSQLRRLIEDASSERGVASEGAADA